MNIGDVSPSAIGDLDDLESDGIDALRLVTKLIPKGVQKELLKENRRMDGERERREVERRKRIQQKKKKTTNGR